ncbi:hypothetical protein BDQ17DRAFT_1329374 [Cyathus striatus]|nr:hypothetical protein BDQ17DRAFT_1329374 [Cyathus striatus]
MLHQRGIHSYSVHNKQIEKEEEARGYLRADALADAATQCAAVHACYGVTPMNTDRFDSKNSAYVMIRNTKITNQDNYIAFKPEDDDTIQFATGKPRKFFMKFEVLKKSPPP